MTETELEEVTLSRSAESLPWERERHRQIDTMTVSRALLALAVASATPGVIAGHPCYRAASCEPCGVLALTKLLDAAHSL